MLVGWRPDQAAKIRRMEIPPPRVLIEQIRALDGFAELAERLPADPPVHLVGGAVRDLLLGRAPRELDLVVEGDAPALARELGGAPTAHPRFGTATVRLGGRAIDLATARRERYARPGALPEVEPADLASDLARRDFTVNAIAVSGQRRAPGRVDRRAAGPRGSGCRTAARAARRELPRRPDPAAAARALREPARVPRRAADGGPRRAGPGRRARWRPSAPSGSLAELRLLAREPDPVAAFAALRTAGLDGAIAPGFGLPDAARAERALATARSGGQPGAADPGARRLRPRRRGARIWAALSAREATVARAVARAADLAARLRLAERPSEIADAVGDAPVEAVAAAGALGPEAAARRWLEELRHVRLRDHRRGPAGRRGPVRAGDRRRVAGSSRRPARRRCADARAAELAEALRAARGHR